MLCLQVPCHGLPKIAGVPHPYKPAVMEPTEVPTPSASPKPALIDPEQLETFIDLGAAAYRDILGDATRLLPAYLAAIRDSIAENDVAKLNASAHKARGTLLTFGCAAMTKKCDELEILKTLIPNQALAIHAELEALWQQTLAAIKQWERSVPEFAF